MGREKFNAEDHPLVRRTAERVRTVLAAVDAGEPVAVNDLAYVTEYPHDAVHLLDKAGVRRIAPYEVPAEFALYWLEVYRARSEGREYDGPPAPRSDAGSWLNRAEGRKR